MKKNETYFVAKLLKKGKFLSSEIFESLEEARLWAMKETKLLTYPHGSTKTNKSMKYGYANFIMYLAPHKLSGHNVCPGATIGCIESCLNESGRALWKEKNGKMNPIHQARLNRTLMYSSCQKI